MTSNSLSLGAMGITLGGTVPLVVSGGAENCAAPGTCTPISSPLLSRLCCRRARLRWVIGIEVEVEYSLSPEEAAAPSVEVVEEGALVGLEVVEKDRLGLVEEDRLDLELEPFRTRRRSLGVGAARRSRNLTPGNYDPSNDYPTI